MADEVTSKTPPDPDAIKNKKESEEESKQKLPPPPKKPLLVTRALLWQWVHAACGTCTHEELEDYFAKVIPSLKLVVPIQRRETVKW
jgi:hypothetical protein